MVSRLAELWVGGTKKNSSKPNLKMASILAELWVGGTKKIAQDLTLRWLVYWRNCG